MAVTTRVATDVEARKLPARRSRRRSSRVAYLYILPAFAVYALFLLVPLGRSVWISLFHWDGLTLATWAGASNYVDIFRDAALRGAFGHSLDRKSTRLNSSHGYISYAVFCLKKKKKKITNNFHRNKKKKNNIKK